MRRFRAINAVRIIRQRASVIDFLRGSFSFKFIFGSILIFEFEENMQMCNR